MVASAVAMHSLLHSTALIGTRRTLGLYTRLYSGSSATLGALLCAAARERTRTPASGFFSWGTCLRCCLFSCFARLRTLLCADS